MNKTQFVSIVLTLAMVSLGGLVALTVPMPGSNSLAAGSSADAQGMGPGVDPMGPSGGTSDQGVFDRIMQSFDDDDDDDWDDDEDDDWDDDDDDDDDDHHHDDDDDDDDDDDHHDDDDDDDD